MEKELRQTCESKHVSISPLANKWGKKFWPPGSGLRSASTTIEEIQEEHEGLEAAPGKLEELPATLPSCQQLPATCRQLPATSRQLPAAAGKRRQAAGKRRQPAGKRRQPAGRRPAACRS
jgi:hypothetical protein